MKYAHLFNLVAFVALLGAIVILALLGNGKTDLAIMTGLVGVLGTFRPWGTATGTKDDPIAVQGAEDGKKPVDVEAKI